MTNAKALLITLSLTALLFSQDNDPLKDKVVERYIYHYKNNWSEFKKEEGFDLEEAMDYLEYRYPKSMLNNQEVYGSLTINDGFTVLKAKIYDSMFFDENFGRVYVPFWEGGTRYLGTGPRMNDKSYVVLEDTAQRDELISFLKQSYSKFEEWKTKALENNITDYSKQINTLKVETVNWYQTGNGFWADTSLTTSMKIDDDGDVKFYVYLPPVSSCSGCIDTESVYEELTLKDIDSIVSLLSIDNIVKHIDNVIIEELKLFYDYYYETKEKNDLKTKKEDLFN